MPSRSRRFVWLLAKEARDLAASRSWWVMLALTGPLVGLSFIDAVRTYSEMSGGAGGPAALAETLTPLDGIFVPTFGAFDLIATFLLPFVAIRAVAGDRQSGALTLLVQHPRASMRDLVAAKMVVLLGGCALCGLAGVLACALWVGYGGAVFPPELVNLMAGHLLRACLALTVAMAAASMTDHPATAAIAALAMTVGSWAYEFVSLGRGGWWEAIAGFLPTALLRAFERGLLRLDAVLVVIALSVGAMALCAIWLRLGASVRRRVAASAAVALTTALMVTGAAAVPGDWDLSENRRSSFTPRTERALAHLGAPLHISARLAPEDPRRFDLEHGVYAKLRRTVPNVDIHYTSATATGLFEPPGTGYGEIWYGLGERRVMERSTAEPIVVATIAELAGLSAPVGDEDDTPVAGHPLVATAAGAPLLFYLVWPTGALCAGYFTKKRRPS